MDPLSVSMAIFTAFASILSAYQAIQHLSGLPEAFEVAGQNLPLVDDTLELIRTQLKERIRQKSIDEATQKSIGQALSRCLKKADKMKEIFDAVEKKRAQKDAKEWSAIEKFYCNKLKPLGKGHRVEKLMEGIAEDLKGLVSNQTFRLATQGQVEELEQKLTEAIDKLANVEQSLDDAAFDKGGDDVNINVQASDNADGRVFQGANMKNHFGHKFSSGGGSMNIGSSFYQHHYHQSKFSRFWSV